MFMCPLSPEGAMVRPRPSWRPGGQLSSEWGRVLPPLRRRVEAEQPPRRRARSAQPPRRRARSAQPRAGLVGSLGEESPGAIQDVSLRLQLFFVVILPTCLLTLPSVFS
jgi:hypothetical protein